MITQEKEIKAILSHLGCHSRLYLIAYSLLLFIVGLWPFNFTEKNNALISPTGGLEIARHGTAYTALPAGKLQDLKQFAIHIDLTTSSDGLGSLEKMFGYFISQEVENFFLGQWKDGMELHVRTERNAGGMIFGADGVLKKEERAACLIIYDGLKMYIYKNGKLIRRDNRGPLSFSNWSREYPLVLGTDANGRSQWRGNLYEVAIYDRALTSDEVSRLSSPSSLSGLSGHAAERQERRSQQPTADSRQQPFAKLRVAQPQGEREENPAVSPFMKGGSGKGEIATGLMPLAMTEKGAVARNDTKNETETEDNRPLIHYVFRPENTYETEIRGKKALGVRDLGKGEPADLVIPEHFAPYERVYLGWDPDWMKRSSDGLDVAVNILGFVPFGLLALLAQRSRQPTADSRQERSQQPTATRKENPPASPFMKGGGLVVAVVVAVVAGFVVSFAIEYLQAYLPSRDSSMRDLVCNTLGTAAGVCTALLLKKKSSMQEITE